MTASPTFVSVTYAADTIDLSWNPDGGTNFELTVIDAGSGLSKSYPAIGFFAQISQKLTGPGPFKITIACTDNGGTGPASPAIPIITAAPTVTLVQNAVNSVNLKWNAVANYNYVATLFIVSGERPRSESDETSDPTMSFPLDEVLSGNENATSVQLRVTVDGAISSGPPTTYDIITAAPSLTRVDYSQNKNLTLTWATLAGYATFKAYLQVPAGEPAIEPVEVKALTATFPGQLGTGTYTTYVCACSNDGVSVGPPSTVYNPVTVAPTMTQVINTGAGLQLVWQQLQAYTDYNVTKQQAGSPSDTKPAIGTSFTFSGPLSGSTITCFVAATSNKGVAIGPPSNTYTAIVGQPVWQMIDYEVGALALSWTPVTDTGVTGYLIEISGLAQTNFPVGNVNKTTIQTTLIPLESYPATVRATQGIVWGPQSFALVPLTAPPIAPSLGFNGTSLLSSWRPSGESDVTGYAVKLMADGAVKEQAEPSKPPQIFTAALDLGVVFTSQVRATGAKTKGPWSAVATGPYRTELNYTFDSQGRLNTIQFHGGAVRTYIFDSAGNLLSTKSTA